MHYVILTTNNNKLKLFIFNMKRLIRSKSDTDMFVDKKDLDIIHSNLKNFKNLKVINQHARKGKDGRKPLEKKKSARSIFMNSNTKL